GARSASPGPITTGCGLAKTGNPVLAPQLLPGVMVPAFAGTTPKMWHLLALLPKILPHLGLDLGHAAYPAVVVLGLLAHVAEHLRVGQDQECLLRDAGERVFRDLLGRQIAVAALRTLGNRAQHVGVDALRAEDRDAYVVRLV